MPESEFILLRRFASNDDAEAFSEIIKQHASLVYGVCLRILEDKDKAADAVQETFLQLVRDAAEITGSLPNWLHRVATHKAINIIRSDSHRKQREEKYAVDNEKNQAKDNLQIWQEISGCIDEELDQLDELTREVLILHFFEGRTMTNIAEKFGISQPTVSRRIESGVASLRYKLKSRGVIVPAAILTTLLTENIVKAAPASIMKELGKIAIAGGKAATGTQIATGISAIKSEIIAFSTAALIGIGSIIMYLNYTQAAEPEAANNSKPVAAKIPAINELLDNYTKALDSIQSFIGTFESTTVATFDVPSMGVRANESRSFKRGEYRTDGKGKTYQTYLRWGDITMNDQNVPESKADYRYIIAGDDFRYSHNKRLNQTENNIRANHGTLDYVTPECGEYFHLTRDSCGTFTHDAALSYLLGYFDNRARLDATLKNEAKDISIRKEPEIINGSVCYVVEADTKRGEYTIWLDSEHGYHPARIKAKMGTGDDAGDPGSPRILTKEDGAKAEYTLDNVSFEKIEGFWVPMEADSRRYVIQDIVNSFEDDQIHFKFTKITLNPDHEALNSFGNPVENPELDPELVDNTRVSHFGYEDATWKDGKVIDNYGNEIDLNNRGPKVGVGQALPSLSEFNIIPDFQLTQNRRLLVCFWDRDQRPSRNAILSLNKRAETLLEKDLYMIFIHAGTLEEKALISWLKRNEILPPVGISDKDLPVLERIWGVQALPWLILTDKKHIVTDEGFSIDELDEKIN